ncbi:MAG TPA: ATP-binding protein [Candidatus Binatia bacterium]
MKKPGLARYFLASVLLLLLLVSLYGLSESRRLQKELLRQTESKGLALAEAMEASAKNAILGNALLEKLVSERLLDNARLIDRLLLTGPLDSASLNEISDMNRLNKIEVLDRQGHPWEFPALPAVPRDMREMMAEMRRMARPPAEGRQQMMIFMWGRSWVLPGDQEDTAPVEPPPVTEQKFWEGSVFGVAIGARSIPGIIAVHANADYILNFKKEIGVQRQIEELGRQPDIHHVALLDGHFTYVAHTDPSLMGKQAMDDFAVDAGADWQVHSRIVDTGDGRVYELIKAISLNNSPLGYLKIGLSLAPMEAAWRGSLWSILVLGLAILAVGIMGMAAIFYNQNSHIREIESLEAEVARRENLSALGNLAATVAHEVRNPLNAISMGLQRLKAEFRPTEDEEQYSRFIELMRGEVHRLNSIVEQFLSLARPLELKLQPVRMDELLQELALFTGGDARSSKVEIRVEAPSDLPSVRADRDYLKQLLLNLILNGIQAMPKGGSLTLEAGTSRRELVLTVADTGRGIPTETLERIFEPYYTTKSKGSGLGLSIARRIAEAHAGTLAVESEVGRGSRFTVRLPVGGPAKSPES